MTELTTAKDWTKMRENVRRAVGALELCWRCQRISECKKYVLGNLVLVWLCSGCMHQMEQLPAPRPTRKPRQPR